MPIKPTEILKKMPDTFSVLIGDFYAGKSIFNKKTITGRQESDMRNRMFRMLRQTYDVCQKSISKKYAIDSLRTCNFSIVVFENVGERTTKQGVKYLDNLKGFMTCTISEEDREMKVDLVCAAYRGLGTLLMSYIRSYAKHYRMKSIKLDAATIELACKFYGPKFGYEFSGEDSETDCKGMERRKLRSNKLNQVYARQSDEKMFEMTYQTGIEPRTTRARVAAAARANNSNNNSNNNSAASENAYQGNNNTVASNNIKGSSSRKGKKNKVLKSLKRKRARPNVKKSRTKKLNRRRRRTHSSMSKVSYNTN